MAQDKDGWDAVLAPPAQAADPWDAVLGGQEGGGWDAVLGQEKPKTFTSENPKTSAFLGGGVGMPGEAAAWERIQGGREKMSLTAKAIDVATQIGSAFLYASPEQAKQASRITTRLIGGEGFQPGKVPDIEDIRKAAETDPFIAKLLDVFSTDQAQRDAVFAASLAGHLAENPPTAPKALDEHAALLAKIGAWNKGTAPQNETEILRSGQGPLAGKAVPPQSPEIKQAYDLAHQDTAAVIGPVMTDKDVARNVFQYVAAQEADALNVYDKEHPYQSAALRLTAGAIPLAQDMAEAAIAGSMLTAIAPEMAVETALAAGVRPARPIFRQLMQWATFESARQVDAIQRGQQQGIDPAAFAENVASGTFGGMAGSVFKAPWKQALVAQAMMSMPALSKDILRSTGVMSGQKLTSDQIIARAIEMLGYGALAAVMHPIAPGVTRELKDQFVKEVTAEGMPPELQRLPVMQSILDKITSPDAAKDGVSFTGSELMFANEMHKRGWLSQDTIELMTQPPAQEPAPEGGLEMPVFKRSEKGPPPQGIGTVGPQIVRVPPDEMARRQAAVDQAQRDRAKGRAGALPLERVRAAEEQIIAKAKGEEISRAETSARWENAVRDFEAGKRPHEGPLMRGPRPKRGVSGQMYLPMYVPPLGDIFYDPRWPQEKVDEFIRAAYDLANRFSMSAGMGKAEMEQQLSPFSNEKPRDLTVEEMQAQLKHSNLRQTLDELKYGTLKDKVIIGSLRTIVGDKLAQRIGDAMIRSKDSADVARMRKEIGPLLAERAEFSAARARYEQEMDRIAGSDRFIRDRLNSIAGHRVNGRVDPQGEDIPGVNPADTGKIIAAAKDAATIGRAVGERAKNLGMIPEGEYVTSEGKRLKVYKQEFDSGKYDRANPPGTLVDGFNFYEKDGNYYWPHLLKKTGFGSLFTRFWPGQTQGAELSAKKLHQADERFMSRALDWEEFLAAGGDPSFAKGFSEMMKQFGAVHQAEMLDWAERNGIVRTKDKVPGAMPSPIVQKALSESSSTINQLRAELRRQHVKFDTASSDAEKASALKDSIGYRSWLVSELQKYKELRLFAKPDGWLPLGPEYGTKYEGKYIRSDFYRELTEGPQTAHAIASFLGGIQSTMAGNVTYKDVLRHLPQDWISNLQQMSFAGTRPFSLEGIATQVKMTRYIWDAMKGKIAPDPIFREWLSAILGGDRVSGAGQFTQRDIENVDRYLGEAERLAMDGNKLGAAAFKLGGVVVHLNKAFERAAGLQVGSKIGRMSDLVPSASFWYMLRNNIASDFGFPMSTDEAATHHDTYFSYSNISPMVASISRYLNFLRYPHKAAASTLEYGAVKPMKIKTPTGEGISFDFPFLDKIIHADPGSPSAQAAIALRAATNVSASIALKVAPFLAVRMYALSRLGSSQEEFDKELNRSLSWMPSAVREGVKLFTIPWSLEADGSFRYFDFSSWVPWMALPKYMAMPIGATTSHESLGRWLLSKNMIATSVSSAFGTDYKGDAIGGESGIERYANRAWASLAPFLPGMVTTPLRGAYQIYRDISTERDLKALEIASQLTGTFQGKRTHGGSEPLKVLTDMVQEADMQGLLENVTREDGSKWLEVRQPDKYPLLTKRLALYYKYRAMEPAAVARRYQRKSQALSEAADAAIGRE